MNEGKIHCKSVLAISSCLAIYESNCYFIYPLLIYVDDTQRCGGFLEGLVGCEGWQEIEAVLGENISMFW